MDGGPLAALAIGVKRFQEVKYSSVASFTVMVVELFLMLDTEMSLLWPSRWNLTKALYFLARYMPFIDSSIILYYEFGKVPAAACKPLYECTAWMFLIGMAGVELIFTMRTWAVWGRGKRMGFLIFSAFGAVWAVNIVALVFYLRSVTYLPSPAPQLFRCTPSGTKSFFSVLYIMLMVYDAGILLLMVIRAVSTFRYGGDSHLMRIVYRDGIVYYIYIFVLSLLNVLVILKLPDEYMNLVVLMERVIHSVLACRVILHIRQQIQYTQELQQAPWHSSQSGVGSRELGALRGNNSYSYS